MRAARRAVARVGGRRAHEARAHRAPAGETGSLAGEL